MTVNNDILFINRDEDYRERMTSRLRDCGYTVHTATEMRAALSALSENAVGLIVCDKELEDIGGYDFLSFIKKDPLRENIPMMFLVPLNNQGRPFKAFELGAVDYLVYPLNFEALIGRIEEVIGPASEKTTSESSDSASPAVEASAHETSQTDTLSALNAEVSRDGIIWMPSPVKGFTSDSIAVQTSLFGKKGVSLMIRFKRPEGIFVVNGRINDISFLDFQKPADIDIAVEKNDNWRLVYRFLTHPGDAKACPPPAEEAMTADKTPDAVEFEATIALTDDGEESCDISGEELQRKAARKRQSYDVRFYNSIIGKQLDNYRAISLIAAGSMGGVLQGWDVALEREVALKIISFELSSKEEFREMFIKEARVVSKLNHPNIAQIYNIGSSNDILYYAMEYIDGLTLKEIIQKYRKLKFPKGLTLLITVCKAMELVYQNSIVHRDIKPANIMITGKGVTKIVDFGVAHTKGFGRSNGTQKLMGTPLYMSPEQIAGLTLDHRSDMYSLGATFYHAFSGGAPFNAKEVSKVMNLHLNATVPPLCERDANIPSEFSKIIEKMMAKDPNHRYQSFKEIANEITQLRSRLK